MKKAIFTLFCLSFFLSTNVQASIISVTSTGDSGAGTLRDAVLAGNPGDTIMMSAALANSTITLTSGPISINYDVKLFGNTGAATVITTGNTSRAFSITAGSVEMKWLTFSNNTTSSGGALINNSTLVLSYCRFENNTSQPTSNSHGGGAIFNNTNAELVIDNCSFNSNLVSTTPSSVANISRGGAICHRGSVLYIYNSSFIDNVTEHNNGAAPGNTWGGAIFAEYPFDVSNCTFYSNECAGSDGKGGAIYHTLTSGSVNISFSTIASNTADVGGNIYVDNNGFLSLQSTIVSNSTTSSNVHNNGNATISTLGGNLLDNWTNSGMTPSASDITADPLLMAPAYNNGAFTQTMEIPCNSPAVNAGNSTNAPTYDQANQIRIYDGAIDIGAYELQTLGPVVTASSQNTIVCAGDSTVITAIISGGTGTYTWDNGIGNGQSHTVSPTLTTTYTVTGTDGSGCSDTSQVTITVNALPIVTANATATAICEGDSLTLTGGGAVSYIWDNGVMDGVAFSPTTTATYTVTGTDGNGCENTDQTQIIVNPLPTPTINQAGLDLMVSQTYNTYQWYLNGTLLSGETNQTITPAQNGNYTVEVTDNNGCAGVASYNLTNLEIAEDYAFNRLHVYPNPVVSELYVELQETKEIGIVNMLGEKVISAVLTVENNTIDVSELSAGIYFLQSEDGPTIKFVKK